VHIENNVKIILRHNNKSNKSGKVLVLAESGKSGYFGCQADLF
jgi:hypothetical protein